MNCKKFARPALWLAMAIGAGGSLSGCNKPEAMAPTQLAAKMGSDEVTLHEVDRAAAQQAAPPGMDAVANRKRLVDLLIDQHLMAAEAVKLKLDRLPDTVSDEGFCRLSTLQHAYLTSVIDQRSDTAESDKVAAQAYYDKHPELFAQRKTFLLKEVVFPKSPAIDPGTAEKLAPNDLLAQLEQHGIKYRLTYGPVASDELSPDLLAAVDGLEDGHSKALEVSGTVVVVTRESATPAAVDFTAAEAGIVRFLDNQATTQRVQGQVTMLRSQANVQYLNEFASEPVASNTGTGQGGTGDTAASVVER